MNREKIIVFLINSLYFSRNRSTRRFYKKKKRTNSIKSTDFVKTHYIKCTKKHGFDGIQL